MPPALRSLLFCLLLALWPYRPGQAATSLGSVLVLSQLPEAYDRNVMATLRHQLQPADGTQGYLIERVELPDEDDLPKLRSFVKTVLLRRPWRLVVATTGQAAQLVTQARTGIPLLFRSSSHPVISCLVHSLRRPGTQATGYTSVTWSEAKMVETLRLAYPQLRQIALLVDGRPEPSEKDCPRPIPTPPCHSGFLKGLTEREAMLVGTTSMADLMRVGQPPQPAIQILRLCQSGDVARLAHWLPANRDGQFHTALVVPYHQLFYDFGPELIDQTRRLRLPAIYGSRNFLPMGALMAMAPLLEPPGEARGVELASRILAGESPSDIPVQRPEGVELIVNLTMARELGVPPSKAVLRAADRLIR